MLKGLAALKALPSGADEPDLPDDDPGDFGIERESGPGASASPPAAGRLAGLRSASPADPDPDWGADDSSDDVGAEAEAAPLRDSAQVVEFECHLKTRLDNPKPDNPYKAFKARYGREFIVVTTTFPSNCKTGDVVKVRGRWVPQSRGGGRKIWADIVTVQVPSSAKGVMDWIRHGTIPGIGTGKGNKIARHFGDDLLGVIDDPARLAEVPGISEADAASITSAWQTNMMEPRIVAKLAELGLGPKAIQEAMRRFGTGVLEIVDENPWYLATVLPGVGFRTADDVALASGKNRTDPGRIRAGFGFSLKQAITDEGHTAVTEEILLEKAMDVLKVDKFLLSSRLDDFLANADVLVHPETGLITPKNALAEEQDIAGELVRLSKADPFPSVAVEHALAMAEEECGVALDASQRDAAFLTLSNRVSVITGGPGTGKSTTQRVIVRALEKLGEPVRLAAPTGRASKRLQEASGRPASTCHRMLEWRQATGGFHFNRDNQLPKAHYIFDEASMLDMKLARLMLSAIPTGAGVTIVGDVDQLPSVGPGQVLRDIIDSESVPVSRLSTVHRQGADSGIIVAAHRINAGKYPVLDGEKLAGFDLFEVKDGDNLVERIVRLVSETLPKMGFDPRTDIQVLAAQKKGSMGVPFLNDAIKATINPGRAGDGRTIMLDGAEFTIGDRVIHTRNDHELGVFNGEVGFVEGIDESDRNDKSVQVEYDGNFVSYNKEKIVNLEQCWSTTIHKSQGSEYPVVIVFCPSAHSFMLTRNLIYTGVTRAKQRCIVVAHRQTLMEAVTADRRTLRMTNLRNEIRSAFDESRPAIDYGDDPLPELPPVHDEPAEEYAGEVFMALE